MSKLLVTGAAALMTLSGVAMAQTTTIITPAAPRPMVIAPAAPPAPVVVAPPAGTLSRTETQRSIAPDGSQTVSRETTYRNSNGVADDKVTKSTTYAPVAPQATVTTEQHTHTTVTE